MSHSYRHVPIFTNSRAESGKWYKTYCNRVARATLREKLSLAIKTGNFDNVDVDFSPFSDWGDPREGKSYSSDWYPNGGFGIQQEKWAKYALLCSRLYESKENCDAGLKRAMRK